MGTFFAWECEARARLHERYMRFNVAALICQSTAARRASAAHALKLKTQAAALAGDTASIAGSSQAAIEQLQAELADTQRAASATEQERVDALQQLQASLQVW